MPERRVKIPFPGPNGPLIDGIEVAVKESTERWSEVELEDGSVLRLKPSVMSAIRLDKQFDQEGNPVYALRAGHVMMIKTAPEHLRKVAEAGKVQ